MHLDRALARGDCRIAAVRLGRCDRELRLRVPLGDAPSGPVRERARELRLDVRIGEPVRDRLVDADRPPELLARLRVLDGELEHLLRDTGRLERERRELRVARTSGIEELLAPPGTAGLFVEHGAVEEVELGDVVARPAPVRENAARLAAQQLLFVGERE